ncbi:hypothetical protein Agub_g10798 [Astrephomene gubernaculifera]|uniref:Major facilitator superfamily (MFS) profile domain-containing protein n=1 Tax=Astrephomene gubernaculifera TaxID=47775 RepID=A0AAD3HQF5_9CHLO|nr:hypothetical protein Agub_g10798 [Astrephomene gubernaculifera]
MLSPVAARVVSGRFSSSGGDNPFSQHRQSHDEEQPLHSNEPGKREYSGRYLLTCLIGYSLSFVVFGSQVSILGPTIAALANKLHVEEPDLSPLFTALGVSCIVSGTPSGWLVDRVPTHRVLAGSLLVQAVGFSLVPLMPSVWSLTALFFAACFSYNFTNSAVFTGLAWMFPKRAGPAINMVLAMFGLGSFFIPLAAQACSTYLGSPLAVFYLTGGLALIAALPFLALASPTRPTDAADPASAEGSGSCTTSVTSRRSRLRPDASRRRALQQSTTGAVVLLVFLTTAAETAIGNWVHTFSVQEVPGMGEGEAALANSAFWGAFTVGRVIGATVSHATTPLALLLGSLPFSLAGCALPLLAGRGRLSKQLVLALAALTGLGNSTGYANAVALLERYLPVSGLINGVFGAVAGGACMVGPVLVAELAKYTSLRYMSMPWVGLVLYALHLPAILTAAWAGGRLLALPPPAEAEQPFLRDCPAGPMAVGAEEEEEEVLRLLQQQHQQQGLQQQQQQADDERQRGVRQVGVRQVGQQDEQHGGGQSVPPPQLVGAGTGAAAGANGKQHR